MAFLLTMLDGATHRIDDVDGYAQEGPLTTFFRTDPGRPARLDPWSTRMLSVRTDRVLSVCAVAHVEPRLSLAG